MEAEREKTGIELNQGKNCLLKLIKLIMQTMGERPIIWCLKCVNFVKNETLKMWILWKMRLWKCEFCEKWDFENVNFVNNEIFKMWILWKMRLWNCEFCEKWDFQNVNFWINWGFLLKVCLWYGWLAVRIFFAGG